MGLIRMLFGGQQVAIDDTTGRIGVSIDSDVDIGVAKVPLGVVKVLAGTPAPIAIVASETFATAVYLTAARADGANVGNVFIGLSDIVSGTKNYHTLTPGDTFEYVCRAGTKVDLQSFLIDGETATDGVIGHYEPV